MRVLGLFLVFNYLSAGDGEAFLTFTIVTIVIPSFSLVVAVASLLKQKYLSSARATVKPCEIKSSLSVFLPGTVIS